MTDETPAEQPTDDTRQEPSAPDESQDESANGVRQSDEESDTFPRSYVEELRQENGKYRQRAQQADTYAQRLHTELVRATGRLADPTDLEFNPDHLEDPDALTAAVDELLAAKPHLASRKPVGDIGQGRRGTSAEPFSLLQLLKERT
ncbi:hypothetical protein AU191_01045 [Mycolicibacterium acapulense]|nr:hypothetical protein AU191_01045 [Mycolicibacterium acapulense]